MDVMDLVHLMGGRVYLDLNVSVTHLIAGEVGSKKYLVAASLGKPILLPSWVHACWEKSQDRYVDKFLFLTSQNICFHVDTDFFLTSTSTCSLFRHTDLPIEDYLCPVLQGCTVSVTGLSSTERKEVQRLCEQHGAKYTGQLKMNECTHLIVNEPSGKLLFFEDRSETLYH